MDSTQTVPANEIDAAGSRLLKVLRAVAFAVAFCCVFVVPERAVSSQAVHQLVAAVARFAPGVLSMSERALDPSRAQLTWALAWMLFPVHLAALIWIRRPWAPIRTPATASAQNSLTLAALIGLLTGCFFIGSDFGIPGMPGLMRGTIFTGGPPGNSLTLLGAPFTSSIGLLLYAWCLPIGNAVIYYLFFCVLFNFRRMVGPSSWPPASTTEADGHKRE
jgi:hypothetical protein